MKKLFLGLATSVLLVGCVKPENEVIWKSERAVKRQLKDPDSAKFKKSYLVLDERKEHFITGHVCGEVNAKNAFGGYTGFKRFITSVSISEDSSSVATVKIETGNESTFQDSDLTSFEKVYWIPSCEKESNIELLENQTGNSKKMKRL